MNPRMCIAVVLACSLGCGGSTGTHAGHVPNTDERLMEIGNIYREYANASKSAPRNLADFDALEPANQAGYAAIRDGDIVMLWGGAPGTSSAVVLAYEKKVPQEGGSVLMQDGTVKSMTAAEFQAAPKAGK